MAVSRLTRQAENYGISPGNPLADVHTFAKEIQSAPTAYFYKTYPTILGSFGAPKTAKVTYPLRAADPMVLLFNYTLAHIPTCHKRVPLNRICSSLTLPQGKSS